MWRSLAIVVEYGPVEMVISYAVGMLADIHISFVPVRMAPSLRADFNQSCPAMYSSNFVTLRMANQPECLLVFPGLNGRRTAVFRTDGRP